MTDGQWLFAVMAALYLAETIRLLPMRAALLMGSGSAWSLRSPLQYLSLGGRGLSSLSILPPMQTHLVCLSWVLIPKRDGLLVNDSPQAKPITIPWQKVAPIFDGSSVRITREVTVRFPNEVLARTWSERLRRWRDGDALSREEDFLLLARQSLDVERVTSEAQRLSYQLRWLRWIASAIFVWCFMVITVIYKTQGEGVPVLTAAGTLVLLLWIQGVLFWRTTRQGELRGRYRFWQTLAIAFLPQAAMRATDTALKGLAFCPHPLATRLLIGEQAWLRLCRTAWKQGHLATDAVPLEQQALSDFFRAQSIAEADLEEVPVRQPGSAAYCPRCLAQFSDPHALCKDCGGMPLKTWPSHPDPEAGKERTEKRGAP